MGLSCVHKRSPESQSWARPRRPAELGEDPGPLRVLRGPPWAASPAMQHCRQGRPRAAAPSPAAGRGASGKGAVRWRKDLCVAGAHTPLAENASAPRLPGPNRGTWREPLLRKGRDSEPTLGAGEDSGARGSGKGLGAAPGCAPPQPPPRRRPWLFQVRRNLQQPGAPGWVRLGGGAP